MSRTIHYGEKLEVAYSVSNDTGEVEEVLDITVESESSRDENDILNHTTDIRKFIWEPQEEDIDENYTFNIGGNELSVEVIETPESGIAYWDMEDSSTTSFLKDRWNDNTGYIKNANYNNEIVKLGNNSLFFDGLSSVDYGFIDGYEDNDVFSISVWVYHTGTTSKNIHFLGTIDDSTDNGWMLELQPPNNQIRYRFEGPSEQVDAGFYESDSWFHLVGTYDGSGTCELYQNGSLVGSNSSMGSWEYGTDGFRLGAQGRQDFEGYLDNVKLYNKVLTSTEVSNLYENGKIN